MKHKVLDPVTRETYYFERTETFVRTFMIARALDLACPTPQMIKWLEAQTKEYDNTPMYWQPYAFLPDGAPYVLPWARGAFGYFARFGGITAPPSIERIDPAEWHHGLANRLFEMAMDDLSRATVEVMHEQTNYEDKYWGIDVQLMWQKIRQAQAVNGVVVNPATIRRRMDKRVRSD